MSMQYTEKLLPSKPLPMPVSHSEDLSILIPYNGSSLYTLLFDSDDSTSSYEEPSYKSSKSKPIQRAPVPPKRDTSSPKQLNLSPRKSSSGLITPTSMTSSSPKSAGMYSHEVEERRRAMATFEEEDSDDTGEFDIPPGYIPSVPHTTKPKSRGKAPRPGYIRIRIRLDGARVFKLNISEDVTLACFRSDLSRRIISVTGLSEIVQGCSLTYYDGSKDRIRLLDQEDWEICKRDNASRGIKMEMVSKFAKKKSGK